MDCVFEGSDLSEADLRASLFERTNFNRANLRGADLRRSAFEGCTFESADFTGTILNNRQHGTLPLSSFQASQVAWTEDDGPEPDGG